MGVCQRGHGWAEDKCRRGPGIGRGHGWVEVKGRWGPGVGKSQEWAEAGLGTCFHIWHPTFLINNLKRWRICLPLLPFISSFDLKLYECAHE